MTERMGVLSSDGRCLQPSPLAARAMLRPAARRLAAVGIGFAGGWAVLYGALMPFGLGLTLGLAEDCFAPCAAGTALGLLLHGLGELSLRSLCQLCALGAAVAARWLLPQRFVPAALAGCGTLTGMALCFALRPLLEQNGSVEAAQLPGELSRCIHPAALCAAAGRSFALYRSRKEARIHSEAMRTALTEQYSAVAEALGVLSEQLGRPGDPEPYKSSRVAEFFTGLGAPPQECAVTLDDLGRTHAAVTLPRTRFTPQELAALAGEVGHICRRTLEVPQVLSCKGVTTLLFSERPALRAVFGAASAAARGEVSGDAVQQFCSPTAAQMILCDGMGTGRPAAVDGNLAAELTARLLKAGFTAELAARLVNVALALKSEDESGATLDLISVDLYTGTARLFKAGAAPGFLVHGGRVRAVGEATLPMGVLGGVNGQSRVVHLTAGDYAVLVSDGLLVDGAGWVAKQVELSAAAGDAPEKLAETLVQTARIRAQKTGRPDDITAAVLRLEKSG